MTVVMMGQMSLDNSVEKSEKKYATSDNSRQLCCSHEMYHNSCQQ